MQFFCMTTKPKLVDLPRRPSEVSRSACEAAEEFHEMGARGEVSGFVVVYLNYGGSISRHWGFDDRLRLVGALDYAKAKIMDSE